jgi:Uma2 family endonuclease
MRVLPNDVTAAVDHLPQASVLALDGISWAEYSRIGAELADRSRLRITYDRGRLEIVTTSPAHEKWKEFVQNVASRYCEEARLHMESCGGMTRASPRLERAVEPDTCFYIGNARRVIGNEEIDIERDPPPDVVVEVDKASQSLRKLPIYAAFGVPEIWRIDIRRERIEMLSLEHGAYVAIPRSRCLPLLTGEVLVRFFQDSRASGQIPALIAFRDWVRDALAE